MPRPHADDAVRLRLAEVDDLPGVLELYRHLHFADDPLPSEKELERLWQHILANPMLHYWVAEVDGQLVATCNLTVIPNLTRGARPYGLIENVVTHADYRRRGLGRQILQQALHLAWQRGCYKVMLMTGRKQPEVLSFYESAGFEAGSKTAFVAHRPYEDSPSANNG